LVVAGEYIEAAMLQLGICVIGYQCFQGGSCERLK
jgi:hypothetical protein